jgi:hypothetical protein
MLATRPRIPSPSPPRPPSTGAASTTRATIGANTSSRTELIHTWFQAVRPSKERIHTQPRAVRPGKEHLRSLLRARIQLIHTPPQDQLQGPLTKVSPANMDTLRRTQWAQHITNRARLGLGPRVAKPGGRRELPLGNHREVPPGSSSQRGLARSGGVPQSRSTRSSFSSRLVRSPRPLWPLFRTVPSSVRAVHCQVSLQGSRAIRTLCMIWGRVSPARCL